MVGINYSGSSLVNVSNNYLGNITSSNAASTTAALRGITLSITSQSVTVNNNTLYYFRVSAPNTGTLTNAALGGILMTTSNSAQTITNNTISNFVQNNSSAIGGSVLGIYTSLGVNNVSNNQVRNITTNTLSTGTTTSTSLAGIMVTSSGTGQIIQNNLIDTLNNNGSANTTTFGLYTAGVTLTCSNNIIRRVTINSTSAGSTTSSSFIGIYYPTGSSNNNFTGNSVYSIHNSNPLSTNGTMIGMYYSMSTVGANFVQKNLIHSIGSSSTNTMNLFGTYQAGGTITTQNNMIRMGIDKYGTVFTGPYNVYGIYIATSSANNLYHNTVYLGGNPLSGTGTTAAAFLNNGGFTMNIKNNIFHNAVDNGAPSGGSNYAFRNYVVNSSIFNSNFNQYAAPGFGGVLIYNGFNATGYTNLKGTGGWQLAYPTTPLDMNSAQANAELVDATGDETTVNLHSATSNTIESAGDSTLATLVTDDFDGQTRSSFSPFDIGADAGDFTRSSDAYIPLVNYTALTNTPSVSNRSLTVTLVDNAGIDTVAAADPILYYKKASASSYTAATGSLTSGTLRNGTWTFTINYTPIGGVVPGDTIQYFVVAQDAASNVAFNPTYGEASNVSTIPLNPTPRQYTIALPLATVINVGAGYSQTSLTAADTSGVFYMINNGFLQGNTVVNIMSDTIVESGATTLNKWLEVSGTTMGTYNYTLTIQPGTGGTVAQKLLTGNVAQAMIRFNNASNINISGIGSGGASTDSNLVIRNTNTGGVSHFQIINDATNISFRNVILEGRSSLGAMVAIQTTTLQTGNDNISFNNCIFRADTINASALSGINCLGTTGKENDNISVIGCRFENINNTCLSFTTGTGNNISVKNNHVYWNRPFTSGNTVLCINLSAGLTSNGDTISGNYFGGSAPFCAGSAWNTTGVIAPIQANVGNLTGVYIQGNTIQNFTTSSQFIGMNIVTNGIVTVTGNTICHATTANSIVSTSNAINTGIISGTPGNITITNNTIANLFMNGTGTTGTLRGIAVSGGSTNTTVINNNTLSNLTANSTATNTLANSGLVGIVLSSSSSNQTISGNTLTNFVNTNNTTSNISGAYGILTFSGTNTVTNNTVNGITNNSMYTGNLSSNFMCAVTGIGLVSATGGHTVNGNTVSNLINLPSTAASTQVVGIGITNGNNITCNQNVIRNLTTNSVNTGANIASGLIGLEYTAGGSNNIFSQNTIHSLQLQTTALPLASSVIGFYYNNSTAGNNTVTRNNIHSLRNATSGPGLVVGIFNNAGTTTFSNNMIRLGIDSGGLGYAGQLEVRGIFNNTTSTNNFYHNTVYVGGNSNSGGSNTYAFYTLNQVHFV